MGLLVGLVAAVGLVLSPLRVCIADEGIDSGVSRSNSGLVLQPSSDEWTTEYEIVGTAEPPVLGPSEHDWEQAALVEQGEARWVVRVNVREVVKGRPPTGESGKVTYIIHSPTRFFGVYGYVRKRLYTFRGRWRRDPATGEVARALRVEPHWLPLWAPNVAVAGVVALGCSVVIAVTVVLIRRFERRRRHEFRESRENSPTRGSSGDTHQWP